MSVGLKIEERLLIDQSCLGLNVQRAARVISKKFDKAFKPFGINHWQFDMLVVLSLADGLRVGEAASLLIVDRTTITANLKPLVRKGLVSVDVDITDARSRRIRLTSKGEEKVRAAYHTWKSVNDEIATSVRDISGAELLGGLASIANDV